MGRRIPLLLTSGDIFPWCQSQGESSIACVLKFTSGATPADYLMASIAGEPFWYTYLCMYIIETSVELKPWIECAVQCLVFVGERLFIIKYQNYEVIKHIWTIQILVIWSATKYGKRYFQENLSMLHVSIKLVSNALIKNVHLHNRDTIGLITSKHSIRSNLSACLEKGAHSIIT